MSEEYRPEWQTPSPAGAHAYVGDDDSDLTYVTEPAIDSGGDDEQQGKAGVAKEQAAAVGQGAAQAGQQVASVAKDQAQNVVAEAGSQAKDLLGQAKTELSAQAGTQQQRLAEMLKSLAGELESMTHHDGEQGIATNVVRQASDRAHGAVSWLESGEPDDLLKDVQNFARQRPAAFLALAAGAGLLAGRLGRGVKDASSDDGTSAPASSPDPGVVPTSGGTFEAGSYAAPAVADRPFASSQVEDFSTFPDGGVGR